MSSKVIEMSRSQLEAFIMRLKTKETFMFSELITRIEGHDLVLMASDLLEVIECLESKLKHSINSESKSEETLEEVNVDEKPKCYH